MRTQDSLSRCDPNQYSSIYQVRQHPDFKNEPVFPSSQKDTLQINKKELKKEALKRLNHSAKYTVAQQGFMRIGRVVFLAAALPPYLIFYKIPQSVVSQFIPFIFSSLKSINDRFSVTIKQKALVVVQSMTRAFKITMQVWQVLTQPIFKVLFSAQKLGHSIYQKVASFFGEWNQQFKKVLNGVKNQLKKLVLKFRPFSKKSLQVQQRMTKGIQLSIDAGLNWAQTIFKQFTNKIQLFKHSAKFSKFLIVKQQFKIKFEQAQRFATLFTYQTKRLLEPLQYKLASIKNKVINRYHQFVQPLLNKIQKQQQLIGDFFGQKGEKWRAWIQSSTTKLKHITPPEMIVYLSSRLSFLWILKPFKSFFKFLLKHNFTKDLVYQLLKLATLVLRAGLQAAEFVLNGIVEGWRNLKKGLHVIFSGMKIMIRLPISYFNSFISLFKTFSYKGLYGGLVVIAMSVILFGWGMQLLAAISTRIFSKIKFNQST